LKGCIIKILDKNLCKGLSKIGNNSEQHTIGDKVFWGIAWIKNKILRVCAPGASCIKTLLTLTMISVNHCS
jgi:hypothetical protein